MLTDTRPTVVCFSLAASTATFAENADGTATLTGLEVFKAGTFRDSLGDQATWTAEHLTQMVSNFNMLSANGSFPNVPVRSDHGRTIQGVVGYVTGLTTDGQVLRANVDITEPDAVGKWKRKTYRGRSAEVGLWATNDEALYYPVFKGVAFVDIPAVEGLYSHQGDPQTYVKFDKDKKETQVPETKNTPEVATFTIAGKPVTDVAAVQAHISGLEAAAVQSFTINGAASTDFAAVQTHITALEQFAKDTAEANRKSFVEGLVSGHKIAATQKDSLSAHALSLTDEQFTAFRASYEGAPVVPLFNKVADGKTNLTGEPNADVDEKSVLEQTIAQHRRSGMSDDVIKQTVSYKRLEALTARTS